MTQPQEVREAHPYFMYDAIQDQPRAAQLMLDTHRSGAREVAETLAAKKRIYLVGIGTSWHAALAAEHWFRGFAQGSPEVQAWHSFEFCSYPPALSSDAAVVVISHRGTKTYSFLALELAKNSGAFTVAITSTNPGPRIQAADLILNTVAQERSAAFTVSYTSALTVLALISTYLGGQTHPGLDSETMRSQLGQVPGHISQALFQEPDIREAVEKFLESRRFLCTGWGPNTANAYEMALKMKETSTVDCEGFQTEQLLHGPFCSVDQSCLMTLIAPPGPGYERSLDIARACEAVGATPPAITPFSWSKRMPIGLPPDHSSALSTM